MGSKKFGGAKTGRTSSITVPSEVGIVGRAPAVDQKVWCFLSVCLFVFVTLWNDEVCDCDNGNDMKQYKFQNNYGVIAWRKVCSCTFMFKFSYRPTEFFPRGKFFTKNYHFWRFLEPYSHILKATTVKFGISVRLWGFLPRQKLWKLFKGYTPFG